MIETLCPICNKYLKSGAIIGIDVFEVWNGQIACSKEHAKKIEQILRGDAQ